MQRSRSAVASLLLYSQRMCASSSQSVSHAFLLPQTLAAPTSPPQQSFNRGKSWAISRRSWGLGNGSMQRGEFRQQNGRRHYGRSSGTSSNANEAGGEAIAKQMIEYAAASRKNVALHVEVVRVLEQGHIFLLSQGPSAANAAAKVLLTLATFHVDGGKLLDAVDVLQQVTNLEFVSVEMAVSARQALVGMLLRLHKDADAHSWARSMVELVNAADGLPLELSQELKFRAAATLDFVEHASGYRTTGTLLDMTDLSSWLNHKESHLDGTAAALLGIGECAHIRGHFSQAKDYYEKASALAESSVGKGGFGLSAGAMTAEDVLVGAATGLGQVAAHLGEFDGAEVKLTEALKHAEQINGDNHQRVGAVLACLADVYAQRGLKKGSGDLVLTEGLYRKAIELLRAPSLHTPGQFVDLNDVVAITRARFAALLGRAKNRDSEAHRLQAWANATWKGFGTLKDVLTQRASTQPIPSFISNKEELENADIGRYVVIDVRVGRVLYSRSISDQYELSVLGSEKNLQR